MPSITCTNCGAVLKTKDPVPPGKKVKCPKCTQVFEVTEDEEAADGAEPEEKDTGIEEESPKKKKKPAAKNDDDEDDEDGDDEDGGKKGKGKGKEPKKSNTMLIVIIVVVVLLFCCICPGICAGLRFFLGVGANIGGAVIQDAILKDAKKDVIRFKDDPFKDIKDDPFKDAFKDIKDLKDFDKTPPKDKTKKDKKAALPEPALESDQRMARAPHQQPERDKLQDAVIAVAMAERRSAIVQKTKNDLACPIGSL